jgi:hypothetical protein
VVAAHDQAMPWAEPEPGKPALAHAWAAAVLPYAPDGTGRAEVQLRLRGQLETLHDALLAEPPGSAAAESVGTALVELQLHRPEALGVTVTVLADRLLAELGLDEATFAGTLHSLLGALAVGYVRSLTA